MNTNTKTAQAPKTAQHTPGPSWKADEAADLPPAVIEDTPEGMGVCECRTMEEARLIAAAPDLLAALKTMLTVFNNPESDPMTDDPIVAFATVEKALAAIAKATSPA